MGYGVGQRFLALLELVHHHHVDVGAVGAELHAQFAAGFNHIHPRAYQLGGFAKLLFQALPVVYQHNFVVVQVTAGAQHAGQKNHGQRLARALRVPHHAAALGAAGTRAQPLQNLCRCTVLLVSAHRFDARAAVRVHKHRAGAQYLQQIGLGQHARHQPLLRVHARKQQVVLRVQRFPIVKMLFAGGDGAVVRLKPTTANQQQVAVKQARLALAQACRSSVSALVHVALQLHKGFRHGVGTGFRALFALHHAQRYAVDQQHDVRNDELAYAAGRVDAELVDGVETVVLGVCKVNQLHHRVSLARGLVNIHLRLEQQRRNRLVGLQQRAIGLAQQLAAQVIQLSVGEPRRAVGQRVDAPHRRAKNAG